MKVKEQNKKGGGGRKQRPAGVPYSAKARQQIKHYEENTKGVIKIGLHIITSYSDKAPDNQLFLQFHDSIPLTFERMQKDLCKRKTSLKPNLMICWKIPKNIVFNSEHAFPGLWAFAKIYPVIKHKGAIE